MLAAIGCVLFNTFAYQTCRHNAVTLLAFTVLHFGVIGTFMLRMLNLQFSVANATAAFGMVQFLTFVWNFYECMWHAHCHRYYISKTPLRCYLVLFGWLFDSGIHYDLWVQLHPLHHKYCDSKSDINWGLRGCFFNTTPHTLATVRKTNLCASVALLLLHTALLLFLFSFECYNMIGFMLAYGWFCRSATDWLPHYTSRHDAGMCSIDTPEQRTLLENCIVFCLVLTGFEHHQHHGNSTKLITDPAQGIDGHAMYLAFLTLLTGDRLIFSYHPELNAIGLATFHTHYFLRLRIR